MTGHVDATLGERPNINVNFRVPGTLDLDDWLGVSSARPEMQSVRLGTLDGDPGIRPRARQFTGEAVPWEPIPDDGLTRFPGRLPAGARPPRPGS
jgi:hypothetical protein